MAALVLATIACATDSPMQPASLSSVIGSWRLISANHNSLATPILTGVGNFHYVSAVLDIDASGSFVISQTLVRPGAGTANETILGSGNVIEEDGYLFVQQSGETTASALRAGANLLWSWRLLQPTVEIFEGVVLTFQRR